MTDTEAPTQRIIVFYRHIQLLNSCNQIVKLLIVFLLTIRAKTFCFKCGRKFKERKTAAQSIIQHRKAAICCIHHANDVDVCRDGKFFI